MDEDNEPESLFRLGLESAPRVPLPELLFSEETREPFERCIECGVGLISDARSADESGPCYQISKKFVRKEAVFEFAMCMGCAGKLQTEFSEQTRQAIWTFLTQKLKGSEDIAVVGLEGCMVCQKAREDCYEYSLGALCMGRQLILGIGPLIMCGECELAMNDLISKETRDRWDRFVDDNFDSPPWAQVDSPDMIPMLF